MIHVLNIYNNWHFTIFVTSFKMVLADDELSASISKESAFVIDRGSTVSGGMTDSLKYHSPLFVYHQQVAD